MWTRAKLKDNAKIVLKKSYFQALVVSIMLSILSGGTGASAAYRIGSEDWENVAGQLGPNIASAILIALIGIISIAAIFKTIFSIMVAAPFTVGAQRYFLESTQFRFSMSNVIYGFSCGHYTNVILTMLLKNIYQFLWSLLFFFPGVVKGYAYSMVPFILAENPAISPKQAIDISCRMTRGHKWNMFVLDLSFFGWYLLGMILFFIGTLFVNPYYNSTHAQLYLALRSEAIDRGVVSLQELESGAF